MALTDRIAGRARSVQKWAERVVRNRLCRFPLLVLIAGYIMFLLPRTVGPFDDDCLCVTTPAVVLAAVLYVVFHYREIRKDADLPLFYGWYFAIMFPLAPNISTP